jgi:hypothetical protein
VEIQVLAKEEAVKANAGLKVLLDQDIEYLTDH